MNDTLTTEAVTEAPVATKAKVAKAKVAKVTKAPAPVEVEPTPTPVVAKKAEVVAEKAPSLMTQLRRAVATNPNITVEALTALAKSIKPAVTTSTVTTVLSDTRQIIAALREVGWTAPKSA
jgi:hypothetical protein